MTNAFAALADPTRRAIFERVAARPSAVGDLARTLPISRPAVSQHLRVLKEAGLVTDIPDGTRRIYRLDPRGIAAMRDWLDAHWSTALAAFATFADTHAEQEPPPMSATAQTQARTGIAPILLTVQVKATPARAFALFTTHISEWWPRGKTLAKSPHATITIEPRAGGKWFEQDTDGTQTQWGHVLDWNPPSRLLLAWQINCDWGYDPSLVTEVELTFTPAPGGGTLVTLEHRDLERFGTDAARHAEKLNSGWPARLADFAHYADAQP